MTNYDAFGHFGRAYGLIFIAVKYLVRSAVQTINIFSILKLVALLLMSPFALAQSAFEHVHEHDARGSKAHVHGQADLNLNVQGNSLNIELVIPAMDALGFEHRPQNDTEKEKVREIAKLLNEVDSWIVPANEALCKLESSTLSQPYEIAHSDTHKKEQDADDKHAPHSDFIITGQWYCAKANDLRRIRLDIFRHLPNVQTVNAKWIKNGAAGVSTLTVKASELSLE
jgi:hypothetical protein